MQLRGHARRRGRSSAARQLPGAWEAARKCTTPGEGSPLSLQRTSVGSRMQASPAPALPQMERVKQLGYSLHGPFKGVSLGR